MQIKRFTLNSMGTNTYVVGEPNADVMIVDPSHPHLNPMIDYIEQHKMRVRLIVDTHGHFDHVAGNDVAKSYFKVPVWCSFLDLALLHEAKDQIKSYFGVTCDVSPPDADLQDGVTIDVGDFHFVVLETPGHSPGSVCLYDEMAKVMMTGDTLFAGTIGRTDFPYSDHTMMMRSLQTKLHPLPNDVRIFPGHEEDSTLGEERMVNPFFHF